MGGVTKPKKVYGEPPVYSEPARKAHVQGDVVIEAVIDRNGCVVNDHVVKGLPGGLDEAALAAVEGWVFDPATLMGRPVKVYYTLTVHFKVQDSPRPAGSG